MKNKLETVDALQEWGRHFRDKGHPVSLTLFRAAAIILTEIQQSRESSSVALASESQRKAAESADEKPDGQAENV